MLKILVCVKEIPDAVSAAVIEADGTWYSFPSGIQYRMNMYDEYALEEAVRIKERNPGTSIDVISLGPERVDFILKKAVERGAGSAYRWDNPGDRYLSSAEKAAVIASFAAPRGYDIIFTGVISEDLMNGQVGPMTAALLGIPFSTAVVWEEVDPRDSSIEVESELEGGLRARCRMRLPVLLAVQSGINTPRYPSLSNKLRAKTERIEILPCGTGAGPAPRESLRSVSLREKITRGIVIGGSRHDKAAALIRILHEEALL